MSVLEQFIYPGEEISEHGAAAISAISTISPVSEQVNSTNSTNSTRPDPSEKVISLAQKRREKRRQSVVELADEDGWAKEIYFGEPDRSYQDVVVIPGLKRDHGQYFYFEQEIPIEKWNEWRFLEMTIMFGSNMRSR